MSKKNTTTSINATTNTNEKKEGITMSKKNTTATTSTTASPMTASEFKQASYDTYLSYVAFIEGKQDSAKTVEDLSPLMSKYGFDLTVDNLANLLTVKMTAFGKDKGEQAKKVKSISTFRAFVKGGWQDVSAAPVHYPADAKPSKSKNTVTKAQLAEQNAALMAELAALRAAQSATKSEEAATTEQVAA